VAFAVTATVFTVKVPEAEPAATLTLAGRLTFFEVDDNFTNICPVPGVALSVTVPVDEVPPVTVVGERLSALTWKGPTDKAVVWVTVPNLAVIVTDWLDVTSLWVTANVTLV
jgi:hypothetical protein